ncbi:MAG3450 family membrane protein [Mycoplasma phocimorsus]|uniref:MAG3450 family membrane protein n=1 Tax=Mycoplasma phocimorsus TaxID=3045839 RepID=UPI0024BF26B5|nr:hypothetical protein [Mycoplasma phocimorsus]MDJ1646373.1 hypothetical protein [Mycoplasma phocimorsus]MDJ1647062.1 hypothetical protein [Mycoplasma phocimorsus]MDJ1647502.1 hypothetical protein [Mycoplasma phocimorsus]
MSKKIKTYLFITFTLIFVVIPLFILWMLFGRDILYKEKNGSSSVELLPLKYNLIIVIFVSLLIIVINVLLIHFNIFEIKSITYILPFTVVMIALIYTGYQKEILKWWGRVLIILSTVLIAIPTNIIAFRFEEKQIAKNINKIRNNNK